MNRKISACIPILSALTLTLSACGSEPSKLCSVATDCQKCERCIDGRCILDESRLNVCGECDQPDPEEICGDGLDNDCDGETDENCEGPCVGVVCDSPPGPCLASPGACRDGVCDYPPLADGTACDDGDGCTQNDACQGGTCAGTPMICNSPPPNECLDANTLRSYDSNGSCSAGSCEYPHQNITCADGCSNGRCNGDPCDGVVCDNPPSQCHKNPGTCVGGSCQYGYLDGISCDDSDACTQDDTCSSGVCAGTPMICDSPPPNECVDVGFLKIYDTNGSCADGVCTYTYQLIPCNDPPDACHQAAGHCTGASCQYDPVTACIDSDGCCPPGCAGQDDDCPAQSSWDRAYGGSDHYMAYSIQQTSDGGYILAGDTYSFDEAGYSNIDLWVLKLDASGNAAWQKTYGGDEGGWEQDWARSIQQTSDGGYIVAGYTTSFDAVYYDAWVLKLDASGNAAWQKTYGGERFDWVYSIQQTSDEGYIMAGKTDSFGAGWGYPYDAWVLKLDASGNAAWQKTYGGSGYDWAYSIQQTSDEGYIVAGKTDSFGVDGCDTWVLKLDASGNAAWQKTYGGSNSDMAYFIQQTSDDGYILAGETKSFGAGDYDAWVLKLDASGNTAWQKTYGGSMYDMASSIQQTSDGGYILAGNTDSFGAGGRDTWILKLDASGNVAWQKTYGGSDSDWASSVQQTSDWGYVVAGGTKSFGAGDYNAWVLKLEVDGVISGSCPDGIGADTNAVVASTSVSPENSTATTETPNTMVGDTDVVPQDSSATRESLCGN